MEVIFQAHNAVISDRMKGRATRALEKIARRLDGVVDVTVRFNQDGPRRRVEIQIRASGHRTLTAEGESRYYGPALKTALEHLETQIGREKDESHRAVRSLARA